MVEEEQQHPGGATPPLLNTAAMYFELDDLALSSDTTVIDVFGWQRKWPDDRPPPLPSRAEINLCHCWLQGHLATQHLQTPAQPPGVREKQIQGQVQKVGSWKVSTF